VLLACSADLLAPTLKRLSMFVLRAKCKLTMPAPTWPLYGLAGTASALAGPPRSLLPGRSARPPASVIRLPDDVDGTPRVRCWPSPADAPAPPLPALDGRGLAAALEARSGVPRIVAATVEQFVPQMVNLELVGGVNFQKGCYPGQEVVARSQYRGTLKRRAFGVAGRGGMAPGQEVFHSADPQQPAGLVALAGAAQRRHQALIELKLAAAGPAACTWVRPTARCCAPVPVAGDRHFPAL
jgi:folate-binding protein YgfZ